MANGWVGRWEGQPTGAGMEGSGQARMVLSPVPCETVTAASACSVTGVSNNVK